MVEKHGKQTNWELTLARFLNRDEVARLRRWVYKRKTRNFDDRQAQKDWLIIELLLNTGLRVSELADLKCSDIVLRDELSCVVVRKGKGGKYREVLISRTFQDEAKEYLKWKEVNGEKVGPEDVLLYSPKSKEKYSTRALQLAFKRCLRGAKIDEWHSIHHLRHTYASLLLAASKNSLPLVQRQLGHSNITTTQVYTKVFKQEITDAIENLF